MEEIAVDQVFDELEDGKGDEDEDSDDGPGPALLGKTEEDIEEHEESIDDIHGYIIPLALDKIEHVTVECGEHGVYEAGWL
jgi:hypothetical protein